MKKIKETEKVISQYILSIIGLEKKVFYGCITIAAAVVWLVLFTDGDIVAKPLVIVFLSIISLTFIMTILAIVLNLSMYKRETQSPQKTSRSLLVLRTLYITGLTASVVLAIIIYAFNI